MSTQPYPLKDPPKSAASEGTKETDPKKLEQAVEEICGTLRKRTEANSSKAEH